MPTAYEQRQQRKAARERFWKARRAEISFRRRLLSVANQIDHIVRAVDDPNEIIALLTEWSHILNPWARAVATKMITEVSARDLKAWNELGREMGRALQREIRQAPTGQALRGYLAEQVDLITSLPLEAAQRVHKLTLRGITEGTRSQDIAAEILKTGHVTKSRARLIARTEVARTASALVQVRAQYVGSESYVWRTSLDDVIDLIGYRKQPTPEGYFCSPGFPEAFARCLALLALLIRCGHLCAR